MTEEVKRLQEANSLFTAKKYAECIKELKSITPDLKITHNLAIVEYLNGNMDAEEALTMLRKGRPQRAATDKLAAPEQIVLVYEGHETAYYNEAVVLLHTGRTHEAVSLLRRLLELNKMISPMVLHRAICLFQVATKAGPALQQPAGGKNSKSNGQIAARPSARSKWDDDLVQGLLHGCMSDFSKDAKLTKMVSIAFSDVSGLHEQLKNSIAAGGMEQAIYYNDLGIFAMDDGKWNMASLYFAAAAKITVSGCSFLNQSVIYNAGICALMREDYNGAMSSFMSVQQTMKQSAAFWVRVAQAALSLLQQQLEKQERERYERTEAAFSEQMSAGKIYANFQLLHIPGTHTVAGPISVERETSSSASHSPYEEAAQNAICNAISLLVPSGSTLVSAAEEFTHNTKTIQYAVLYWVSLEVCRKNYDVAVNVGHDLLGMHKKNPLPTDIHAALISYLVEALTFLNEPDRAVKTLRHLALADLFVHPERTDGHQKERVESVLVNLAITHVSNSSWKQARSVSESLLSGIFKEEAQSGATTSSQGSSRHASDPKALRAANILRLFLELAQGNQDKAMELLPKLTLVPQ